MGNTPDWMSPKADLQRQNRRSGKHERTVARTVDGKVQAGSGSSWRAKGDVKNGTHLIEHKFTKKGSFSVKENYWQNHCTIARDQGRIPAIIIHFDGGTDGVSTAIVITEYED